MWYEMKEDRVILSIKAVPNSSKNSFGEILEDFMKVKIKAPAVEGAANRELIKFISKSFKISKSEISFVSGETSKTKRISVPLNEKVKNFIKEKESEKR
ncbi:MAG: YggU family protein [Epsilonproteobacteria bacterium]|nr:YggU family protein [Campylobacterota bacterium]